MAMRNACAITARRAPCVFIAKVSREPVGRIRLSEAFLASRRMRASHFRAYGLLQGGFEDARKLDEFHLIDV